MRTLTPARLAAWLAVFAAGLCAVLLVGVAAGPSGLALRDVLDVLREERAATAAHDIVFGVRLPRVALGALVGAALATAGALFQALLRNPLADPFVLGVSGGAAVGGIAALSFGAALGLGYGAVPPAAFASAAIVFLASMAGLQEGARIFVWLIGSLSSARPELIASVALFLVAGLVCALPAARQLNLLALGEESAQQLGVDVTRLQRLLLLATSLMVGAAVSVAGLVGFVGLIIPHLLRLLLGPDHRLLLPTAALGGAAFLVLCDTAARTLFGGRELPVGAITALAGGPLFLWLLRRQQQRAFAP